MADVGNSPGSSADGGASDREADTTLNEEGQQEHARPRKRTRRACDKCSSSRTRCDGECPCRRCQDYGYSCKYNRTVKKRGRLPASAAAAQAASSQQQAQTEMQEPTAAQAHQDLAPHAPLQQQRTWSRSENSQESPGDHQQSGDLPSLHSLVPPSSNLLSTRYSPMKLAEDGVILNHNMERDDGSQNQHHGQAPATTPGSQPVSSMPGAMMPNHMHMDHRSMPPGLRPYDVGNMHRGHGDSAVMMSDESAGQPSPEGYAMPEQPATTRQPRHPGRSSFSTSVTATDPSILNAETHTRPTFLRSSQNSAECRYKFLEPVMPFIRKIMPPSVACDLLDVYLTDPGSSLFRCASPYILTRIFRKASILHPTQPRRTSPALLTVMLWCAAQTADIMVLNVPSSRAKVLNELYDLAMSLISERDPDRWRRTQWGVSPEYVERPSHSHLPTPPCVPETTLTNEPAGNIDDVLTYILLLITVSGGDFKSDCTKWWSKATRLALSLKLHREDEPCADLGGADPFSSCSNALCSCRQHPSDDPQSFQAIQEAREERRRVFWLLYSLDRHMCLSFNKVLTIPDSYCELYSPLPETVWEHLDIIAQGELPPRVIGPPVTVTGTSFFEFFLPLMAILGDIIDVHHRKQHPRLGVDDSAQVAVITRLLEDCERSVQALGVEGTRLPAMLTIDNSQRSAERSREQLVKAYSTHILNVLYVLLHGMWDAIAMLDDSSDWIASQRFADCATHAIAASSAVEAILGLDPELTFMPYLFGIYLLHGSFTLLLFADRMPQVGPNQSVVSAVETIIRAHEVCVVTLNTDFQKYFRKVLRSTLYSVRSSGYADQEEQKARRRALSLYRWTRGGRGLGI